MTAPRASFTSPSTRPPVPRSPWAAIPSPSASSSNAIPAASIDFTLDDSGSGGTGDSGTGENWNYLHSEGRYHFHDLQVDGPTYELAPGETRTVSGRLSWLSWDLWGDDQGHTRMENTQLSSATGIAFGANVSQGDGSIDNLSPVTDETGAFSTVFTMGSENARLSFSAEGAEEASIDFTAATPVAPVEIHLRNEKALSLSFEPQGDPADFLSGATVPVRVQVLLNEWEVWQEVDGSIVPRNHQTGPALGALVTLGLASGDGMWQSGGGSTDADGVVEAGFTLGTQASHLTATVSFQGVSGEGGYVFAPEPWEFQESHDTIDLTLETTGDPTTGLLATVQHRTWETWRHAVSGEIRTRAESLVPAQNAVVAFTAIEGAVTVFSQASAETGLDGTATTLYASEGPVTLAALASFAGHEALVTISAPQGFGVVGNGGDGDDGSGNGTDPGDGNNPDNNPETGEPNPTNPENHPTPAIPSLKLISRHHFMGRDEVPSGGTASWTMKEFFRAELAKYGTDENGEQITVDEKEVEGERDREEEILVPLYLEGWYLTHIEYFEREVLDLGEGDTSGLGDLNLSGFRAPGDVIDILEVLAEAT
ncbi:MAG: hypothetical protein KDN18_19990, partial [Verrucomicrobiae bacterium]|nr:hypothetical protein [Verrucomicrobiae bacterium]